MRVAKERRMRRKARLARKRELAELLGRLDSHWHASLYRGFIRGWSRDEQIRWAHHWCRLLSKEQR